KRKGGERKEGERLGAADVRSKVADPAFTPSVRLLGELLGLVGAEDEKLAKDAERAILRIEGPDAAPVTKEVVERAEGANRPRRARLTHLAGRLAHEERDPDGRAVGWLIAALQDGDTKTRRRAARGLGTLIRTPEIESALAEAYDRAGNDGRKEDREGIALALAKVGGEIARSRIGGEDLGRSGVMVHRD